MKIKQRFFWGHEAHANPLPQREIIVDCFAGGGGASTGIEIGSGRSPDVAINHDKAAIAMHMANHPRTKHYCENLWDVDPVEVCEGRPVGLAWFSPDCTHFSKAKGGKPRKKEIRSLAWIVLRWAARVRPRVIFLENVEEFVTWGPLKKGKPRKSRKGKTFDGWVRQLRELGYVVEWRNMVACDYGAPTSRKRLFLIARCDGQPIVWPAATHASPKAIAKKKGRHSLQPWRTAAEIIDWSIDCPSIFLTKEEAKTYGCKRPLAEKTMKRIAEGIRRYVIECQNPFIVRVNHGGDHWRGQPVGDPLGTNTQKNGFGLVTPFVAGCGGRAGQSPPTAMDAPVGTITAKNDRILVAPVMAAMQQGGSTKSAEEPHRTICASDKDQNCVIAPHLMSYYGPKEGIDGRGKGLEEPVPTVPTENRFAMVTPTLVQTGYGEAVGQSPRCLDIEAPLGTVVAGGGKHALVSAFVAKHFGGMVGVSVETPFPAVTTVGTQNQVVAATLIKNNHGEKQWFDVQEPVRTIVAQGTHHAVVQCRIEQVRAFLWKYYGSGGQWNSANDPTPTITVKDRLALGIVLVGGDPFQIVDIGMRMLTPRELFNAQAFPSTYDIETGIDGKKATKSEQVARCGNSVCPHPASALVKANYREFRKPRRGKPTLEPVA